MLALVLAMLVCVALGAGVVIYALLEARREGRAEFWTSEGEELIAGVRRTGEMVRERGGQLGSNAVGRGQALRGRLPERLAGGQHVAGRSRPDQSEPDLRAAS